MRTKNVALLCGSGAVKNAWGPLHFLKPNHFKDMLTNDGFNSVLASLVFNLRYHENRRHCSEIDHGNYKRCLKMLIDTRNSISQNIKNYQEEKVITVQNEFNDIVEKMILPDCKRLLVVTTNWDTVIDEALKNHPILKFFIRAENFCHLHGTYGNPELLYLPTEIIKENYRTDKQISDMTHIHDQAMGNLMDAQILIIYGLSISALDAELLQVLGSSIGLSKNLEVVKIIDCKSKCVAERINIILESNPNVKVVGFLPSDLDNSIDYSLDNSQA